MAVEFSKSCISLANTPLITKIKPKKVLKFMYVENAQ